MRSTARLQRGVILIVSLIMLMVLSLLAASAINLSTVNLRAVSNMQVRGEAMSVAQSAIDRVLSTNFSDNINGTEQTLTIAVDNGKSYDVAVGRPCLAQIAPIKNTDLDTSKSDDLKCFDALTNPWSACAQTVWQITTRVNNGWFGANVTMVQGTGIKMDNGAATVYSGDASYRCTGT